MALHMEKDLTLNAPPPPSEGQLQHRQPSVLRDAYFQEALAKKTVELSFQEENTKLEAGALEMQIDAVRSDLGPSMTALLKTCARLTLQSEGSLGQLDFDRCISKMEAEIVQLETKNGVSLDETVHKQELELRELWSSLEQFQLMGAEEVWAENLMDNTHGLSVKSTFRDQFREMMEAAVRRAVESERSFNHSVAAWERNFQRVLGSATQQVEDSLRGANRQYYNDRENMYNQHSESLRKNENVWLTEIADERDYIRGRIDAIVDSNYSSLASRCQTAHRSVSGEYQAMLRDLAEHREAYRRAKDAVATLSKPARQRSQSRARSSSGEGDNAASSGKSGSPRGNADVIPHNQMEDGALPVSNIFHGKVPKKTMAFETFTRIHEMELEAIGDPAQRHLALSKKIKSDYAIQSAQVLRSADVALEDLRQIYFKRIIGMRDAFVNGYNHGGKNNPEGIDTGVKNNIGISTANNSI